MSCAKFQENRSRIDGEIDEKHALQIIVSQTLGDHVNGGLVKLRLKPVYRR